MTELRRGWTTGACATAAAAACAAALVTGSFPDPVEIPLPRGGHTAFALAESHLADQTATAAIVKDAGDDPDVTHGALIRVRLTRTPPDTGITFKAGEGVGTVTRPGCRSPPASPPSTHAARHDHPRPARLRPHRRPGEISVPDGETLARQTLNGRLGIVGGLSILGTTGIVVRSAAPPGSTPSIAASTSPAPPPRPHRRQHRQHQRTRRPATPRPSRPCPDRDG